MKNYLLISTIALLSLTASAQKADLLILDEDIETKELEGNFNIKKGSTLKSFLPPKELRDSFLEHVPASKNWDEYQKDAFYMDIKNKSVEDIMKKYPAFSKKEILNLKGKI